MQARKKINQGNHAFDLYNLHSLREDIDTSSTYRLRTALVLLALFDNYLDCAPLHHGRVALDVLVLYHSNESFLLELHI